MSGKESRIVELRQYTLRPGKRDELIELFEREFIESQEVLGMDIIGTFRDADNPDRFVWLRGFPDMESRAKSLWAFYGGPVWKAHREAANATMLDSDNVLLLRPAWDGSRFASGGTRAPAGATRTPRSVVSATICYLDSPASDGVIRAFRNCARVIFDGASGPRLLGAFVTEHSPNTFPALPVREGENVFVCFWSHGNAQKMPAARLPDELKRLCTKSAEMLRLIPTARSRLHG